MVAIGEPRPEGTRTAAVARAPADGRSRRWLRPAAVALLIAVAALAATGVVAGAWVRRTVTDDDAWLQRARRLGDDPAVQAALAAWLSAEIVGLVDPSPTLDDLLPDAVGDLVDRVDEGVEDLVGAGVERFLASDRFDELWLAANRVAHDELVRVLHDDGQLVEVGDGDVVVIDLLGAVTAVLAEIGVIDAGGGEDPGRRSAEVIAGIEELLDVDVPDDLGRFTIYDTSRVTAAREAAGWADRLLPALLAVAVGGVALAVVVAGRRWRAALAVVLALAAGLLALRQLASAAQRSAVGDIPDSVNRAAAEVATDSLLGPLRAATLTGVVVLALLAVAVAAVTRVRRRPIAA